jgi:hypothetical protein
MEKQRDQAFFGRIAIQYVEYRLNIVAVLQKIKSIVETLNGVVLFPRGLRIFFN